MELHEKLEEEQKKNQGNLQHLAKSKKYYEDAERLVNNAEERVNALEEREKDLLNQLVELELENFKLTQQRPRSDSGSSNSSANMLSRRSS